MKFFDTQAKTDKVLTILNQMDFGLTTFESLFDVLHEDKLGEMLYNRYQNEHNRNIISFYLSLSGVERTKMFKQIRFIENCKEHCQI